VKIRIDMELLEYNLRQWFLNIYKVWGVYDGKYACWEVFASDVQEAVKVAISEGVKHPKVVV
jgi:hypothetical protein